jgi:hypothetical protein
MRLRVDARERCYQGAECQFNYIRYDVLPDGLFHHVKTLERMAIGDFASILENGYVDAITIPEYKLTNDRIDT